jgi:hypothetical protein
VILYLKIDEGTKLNMFKFEFSSFKPILINSLKIGNKFNF